jgi:DnaA-homolog protein
MILFYDQSTQVAQVNWRQLTLPLFTVQADNTFQSFYPSPVNVTAFHCLQAVVAGKNTINYIYLWGHSGAGCSHLLQACCYEARAQGLKAAYILLSHYHKHYTPYDLQTLASDYQFVCLDALDCIVGKPAWEKALFHTYNDFVTYNIPFVIAAHAVPQQLAFQLPDLVSRLNSGLLFQIHLLNDEAKLAALQLRAKLRGFSLPRPVGLFLLARLSRHPTRLFAVLDQLDESTLAHHRRLTIPFVKTVLTI